MHVTPLSTTNNLKHRQRRLSGDLLLVVAASLSFYAIFLQAWIGHHAPLSDDLSMIAFSKTFSMDWLKKGLADYFIVYPEYYGPQSNFVRPISNFLYWTFNGSIDYIESNRIQLVILNYGAHLCIILSVFWIVRAVGAARSLSFLIAAGLFAIPTFWMTPTPTYSSFVFDELAALFCILAFIAVQSSRIIVATIFMAFALLTKEIALPVVAGIAIFAVVTRRATLILGAMISIGIWIGFRGFAFGINLVGVYVFSDEPLSLANWIQQKIFNILMLPLGPIAFDEIFTSGHSSVTNRSTILIIINIALIGFIFAAALRSRAYRLLTPSFTFLNQEIGQGWNRTSVYQLSAIISLMGFLFVAYVGANYRYAFMLLPFFYICLASSQLSYMLSRAIFLVLVVGSVIASSPSFSKLIAGDPFENFRYQAMRDLNAELKDLADSGDVIIANDFVLGFANPEAVKILTGFKHKIYRGTSLYLDSCTLQEITTISTNVIVTAGTLQIGATLPECAKFTFESSPNLARYVAGNQILRNDIISYRYSPQNKTAAADWFQHWDGHNLEMVSRSTNLLYYDFQKRGWVFIKQNKG